MMSTASRSRSPSFCQFSINPSISLETIARSHVEHLPPPLRRALGGAGTPSGNGAGMASYLLFHSDFCRELIELGRRDARARSDEISAFLALR